MDVRHAPWTVKLFMIAAIAILGSACAGVASPGREATIRQIPEPQRAAFIDGVVDFDEYEGAVLAVVRCLKEEGIDVDGPRLSRWDTHYEYDYSAARPDASTIHDRCYETYLSFVNAAWVEQNALSGDELAEAYRKLGECLRDAGYHVPEDPTEDDILEVFSGEWNAHAARCFETIRWFD